MNQDFKEEKRFIFRSLRAAAGGGSLEIEEFDTQNFDWSWIVSSCWRQRVLSFFGFYWEERGKLTHFPEKVQQDMKVAMLFAQNSAAAKIKDLKDISAILNQSNISAVPLKGTAFLLSIYKDQPYRVMGDVDVLIHKEDLAKARRTLRAAGFLDPCCSCYRWRDDIFYKDGIPDWWALSGSFCFNNNKIQADVHWDPYFFVGQTRVDIGASKFWDRMTPLPEIGPNVYQMTPVDMFDFTFFHALDFHSTSLVNLFDLAVLMRRFGITLEHLRRKPLPDVPSEIRPSLDCFLTMLEEVFFSEKEWSEFSESTRKILEDIFYLQINPRPKVSQKPKSSLEYFLSLKSFKNRIIFFAGYFFPNPEYYFPDKGWKMHVRHWRGIFFAIFRQLRLMSKAKSEGLC